MAIKCEAIVPEVEVKFPAVMEKGDGNRVLAITESLVIGSGGHVYDNSEYLDSYNYRPCPPGSKFVMKITAEDGREYPRMGRYAMRESEAYWLHLDGPEGCRSLKIKDIDSHKVQTPVGEIADTGGTLQPFPTGTITTITFCDGEWTCEIKEPEKDWLPAEINGVIIRRNRDMSIERLSVGAFLFLPSSARILSEVAARFADEQEFPGEGLPMKWTDEDINVPPSQIDSDGHLELEKEWIRSEYEADRLMRAIRLYKRHLQDQAKV